MERTIRLTVSVLLLKEHDTWVAQCLEYDVAAQGDSINEALESFEAVFAGHVMLDIREGKEPLSSIQQAPKEYWDRYTKGSRLDKTLPITCPKVRST